jgi:hypothetical protein
MDKLEEAGDLVLIGLALLALSLAACGDGPGSPAEPRQSAEKAPPPGWTVYEDRDWGYTVAYPAGWHLMAQNRMPRMGDPIAILSLATFPLLEDDAAYLVPRHGFNDREAFLTILERGLDPGSAWRDFSPRPAHFRFEPRQGSVPADYMRRESGIRFADHWFRFTDAGRHFHVQVYIGDLLPDGAKDEPYRILDTLRFDPGTKPDWPSAG